jgi:hypothetical protein
MLTSFVKATQQFHISIAYLCRLMVITTLFSSRRTPLFTTVFYVLYLRTKEQVRGVTARRVVALVQNLQSFRDVHSVMQLPH